MVITFDKNRDLTELKKLFRKKGSDKTTCKPFDAKRICGTLKFEEDGLLIQQKLRAEWDNRF